MTCSTTQHVEQQPDTCTQQTHCGTFAPCCLRLLAPCCQCRLLPVRVPMLPVTYQQMSERLAASRLHLLAMLASA